MCSFLHWLKGLYVEKLQRHGKITFSNREYIWLMNSHLLTQTVCSQKGYGYCFILSFTVVMDHESGFVLNSCCKLGEKRLTVEFNGSSKYKNNKKLYASATPWLTYICNLVHNHDLRRSLPPGSRKGYNP